MDQRRLRRRAAALRLRPAALICDIFLAPYFLRPMDAATAPGLRTPLRANDLLRFENRFPEPSFGLRPPLLRRAMTLTSAVHCPPCACQKRSPVGVTSSVSGPQ